MNYQSMNQNNLYSPYAQSMQIPTQLSSSMIQSLIHPLIFITAPVKSNDATEYTFRWALDAEKMAKKHGYEVVTLKGDEVNYNNVYSLLQDKKPRLWIHYGHGCPLHLQGQNQCILTRRLSAQEMINMMDYNPRELRDIVFPIGATACPGICEIVNDICNPQCSLDTNLHLVKGMMIYAVACHSAIKLGKCAVAYGAETWIGTKDLLLFPTDSKGTQNAYGNIQNVFLEKLLEGKSVAEANYYMNMVEDNFIRANKGTKYVVLPLIHDKLNRRIIGNPYARI